MAALSDNTIGLSNTAVGSAAGASIIGGSGNVCIGAAAGNAIDGDGNVCIGESVPGEVGVNDSTYIRNINTTAQPIVVGVDGVTVDLTSGKLGHGVSSRRSRSRSNPWIAASEAIYALKPVTFHYKKAIDPTQTLDFGLIAEEVAAVNPELAVRDREGKISNYRRDAVNAILLNEFLKEHKAALEEHRKVEKLEATVAASSRNAVSFSSALTMNRFPLSRCASEIQIVRPLESTAETQPQLQPALLRLSAIISRYFTHGGLSSYFARSSLCDYN